MIRDLARAAVIWLALALVYAEVSEDGAYTVNQEQSQ